MFRSSRHKYISIEVTIHGGIINKTNFLLGVNAELEIDINMSRITIRFFVKRIVGRKWFSIASEEMLYKKL